MSFTIDENGIIAPPLLNSADRKNIQVPVIPLAIVVLVSAVITIINVNRIVIIAGSAAGH